MMDQSFDHTLADREPYVSLRHLVWHVVAVMQSLDRMDEKSELRSLTDLKSRMLEIADYIDRDLHHTPRPEASPN